MLKQMLDLQNSESNCLLNDIQEIAAESLGWTSLEAGAYFHHDAKSTSDTNQEILIVGIPDIAFAGQSVLLLT